MTIAPIQIIKRQASAGPISMGTFIDGYLTQEEITALYESWLPYWPEPLQFRGNQKQITCEMVLEVPAADLKRVYKKTLSEKLISVATANAGR